MVMTRLTIKTNVQEIPVKTKGVSDAVSKPELIPVDSDFLEFT